MQRDAVVDVVQPGLGELFAVRMLTDKSLGAKSSIDLEALIPVGLVALSKQTYMGYTTLAVNCMYICTIAHMESILRGLTS
jgi:hypothetical protein